MPLLLSFSQVNFRSGNNFRLNKTPRFGRFPLFFLMIRKRGKNEKEKEICGYFLVTLKTKWSIFGFSSSSSLNSFPGNTRENCLSFIASFFSLALDVKNTVSGFSFRWKPFKWAFGRKAFSGSKKFYFSYFAVYWKVEKWFSVFEEKKKFRKTIITNNPCSLANLTTFKDLDQFWRGFICCTILTSLAYGPVKNVNDYVTDNPSDLQPVLLEKPLLYRETSGKSAFRKKCDLFII